MIVTNTVTICGHREVIWTADSFVGGINWCIVLQQLKSEMDRQKKRRCSELPSHSTPENAYHLDHPFAKPMQPVLATLSGCRNREGKNVCFWLRKERFFMVICAVGIEIGSLRKKGFKSGRIKNDVADVMAGRLFRLDKLFRLNALKTRLSYANQRHFKVFKQLPAWRTWHWLHLTNEDFGETVQTDRTEEAWRKIKSFEIDRFVRTIFFTFFFSHVVWKLMVSDSTKKSRQTDVQLSWGVAAAAATVSQSDSILLRLLSFLGVSIVLIFNSDKEREKREEEYLQNIMFNSSTHKLRPKEMASHEIWSSDDQSCHIERGYCVLSIG